jgi:hypothetical protein
MECALMMKVAEAEMEQNGEITRKEASEAPASMR